jgi:hypothetical protein
MFSLEPCAFSMVLSSPTVPDVEQADRAAPARRMPATGTLREKKALAPRTAIMSTSPELSFERGAQPQGNLFSSSDAKKAEQSPAFT